MAIKLRLRVAMQFHNADLKNQAVINPCFHITSAIHDPDALCESLADKIAFWPGYSNTPLTIKSYDLEGAPPVYPNGEATRNIGGTPKSVSVVPEAAVCLSFNDGNNRPRHRGRLYFPAWLLGATTSSMATTVPLALRNVFTTTIVPDFQNLGGVDVDWVVWSEVDRAARKVQKWFASDAWAIQRKRGIKETSRLTGTTTG